jgi:hypothetical protein
VRHSRVQIGELSVLGFERDTPGGFQMAQGGPGTHRSIPVTMVNKDKTLRALAQDLS